MGEALRGDLTRRADRVIENKAMRWISMFRLRLRSLLSRRKVEQELDEELRYHLERQINENSATGMTPENARYAALQSIKDIEQRKEECREMRGVQVVETLFHDVRYGARTLRKSPGFTFIALFTLALGIGATTAIFSVVYGVLLRPLPYKDPSRLMVLHETTPKVGTVSVSYPNFLDWRADNRAFSEMAAVCAVDFSLSGIAQPENISGQAVSPNFLSMLGVHPLLGRDFDSAEGKAGAAAVVLLSYPLWQSHFGGDRNVVGRSIALNGRGVTIIGVLPPDFHWFEKTDVLEPIGVWATNNAESSERGERGDTVVLGRLAAGVSFAQARSEMEGIAARLAREYPAQNAQFGVLLQPLREVFVSDVRSAILVLLGAVVFVLLIACANVANLFLMRGAERTKEIALRLAIGASRVRIIRQMLTESFLLASLGGLLGLALAIGGIAGITRLIPAGGLEGAIVDLNGPVLFFAAGMTLFSAFIFGLAPAIHSARANVQSELKEGGRTTSASTGQNRWRGRLVIAEISFALVLLVGAGLMMKSLYRLLLVDPGFRPNRVLIMEMSLRTSQYRKDAAILNFWNQVLYRVRALPGVTSAALGTVVPLTNNHSRTDITLEDMALPKPGSFPHPDVHIVSPGYVNTLGVPLLRGRAFTDADNENAPRAGMINALMAQRYFSGENPIGKRFHFGHRPANDPREWITITGVVGDTRLYGLANPSRLEVYIPFRQSITGDMNLIVKSRNDPAALTAAIRHVVHSLDKDLPISGIATMEQLISNSVSTRRVTLILLGMFSALALVLAAIGIYGVISYSVAQRTHEIGIRMALGAQRRDVLRMVLTQGAKIAGAGMIIGIVLSFGLARLIANLLFSVSAADPLTFAAVAIVLALVAMLACYIPARRALRVDPTVALRHE